ncbi:MAG TPA: hypothetical protein VFF52_16740, partial [Isosphaeraceae bacterium]|nr:hypothetical protein [Isosphaeraceae bacterium]
MTERTACPSILALALLLCGVEPAVAAEPAPAPVKRATNATPRAPRATSPAGMAPSAFSSSARTGGQPSDRALPSAVSSAIERFVRQSGRDVPPSAPPPGAAGLRPGQAGGPSPVPAPRLPPPGGARPGQGVPAVPPTLLPRTAPPARSPGPGAAAATPPSPLATRPQLNFAQFQPT